MNYKKNLNKIYEELDTNKDNGLNYEVIERAKASYGKNKLQEGKSISFGIKVLHQLKDFMIIILIIAGMLSFLLAFKEGEGYFEGILIIAIVMLNVVLGVIQENSAEKALNSLKGINAHSSKCIRNGVALEIDSEELVLGDILIIEPGDSITADGRIIEAVNLKVEESALTGEGIASEKDADKIIDKTVAIGDRVNMVYAGCIVTSGRGKVVVTETGMNTEIGKVASLLNNEKVKNTPLQDKLSKLGKIITIGTTGICLLLFIIGIYQGETPIEMFITATSLAVSAIPESLIGVVTVALSLGIKKMVKKNAIIRRLPAVETLGSASVICSDKTGTLTQNNMTIKKVWTKANEILDLKEYTVKEENDLLMLGALCSNCIVESGDEKTIYIGDPTEKAIMVAIEKLEINLDEINSKYPRVHEIPFDSSRKLMTTVHKIQHDIKGNEKYLVVVKGAPDRLLPLCYSDNIDEAYEANEILAKNALRVIAVAYKLYDSMPNCLLDEDLEKDLILQGLVGMIDPPREEVKAAVLKAKNAGIKTVMITGDHLLTAKAIAKEIGILENDSEAITGEMLSERSDKQLEKDIRNYSVYARVSPEDKIRIVKAWKSNDEVVVMTGDGVNDAPALKASDIGCAMGITGTDVAKDASDMILTDDNFETIIEAVEEGRSIYGNILKIVEFFLSCNLAEVMIVFASFLLGWGSPIIAIQLLFINVVADVLPAFGIIREKPSDDIMMNKPLSKDKSILADKLWLKIFIQSTMFATLSLLGYYIGTFVKVSNNIDPSNDVGVTICFLVIAFSSIVHAFNCRSNKSIFEIKFSSNKYVLGGVAASLMLMALIITVKPLAEIFSIHKLSLIHWIWIAVLSILPLFIVEIAKWVTNRKKK